MLAAGLVGCDSGPSEYEPLDLPPVHVLAVYAATGLDGGALDYEVLDDAGTSIVLPTTSFKLVFDRLLSPPDSNRQAVCLQSATVNVVQPSDCTDPTAVLLHPSYDPVRRQVTLYTQSGDPGVPLHDTDYLLTAYVADDTTNTGFLSFDGIALQTPYQIRFTVQSPAGTQPPYDTLTTVDHFCNGPVLGCPSSDPTCVRGVSYLLQGCSFGGCHANTPQPNDAGAPGLAAEDLQMGSASLLLDTAIGHTAHETQTGENAGTPAQSSLRFGQAMAVIDPYVPSESYLIYKLLANRNIVLSVPWSPAGTATTDPPEVARLRSELVVGMPMPPDPYASVAPRPGEMEWLSEWMLQGAPTSSCQ
jgi:hypothetical protein